MTRYDPFSYGQVRLDSKPAAPAAPNAAPDDLLFADAGPVKAGPPADSSWSLLEEDVDNLLPGAKGNHAGSIEFGTEILGETLPDQVPPTNLAAARPRAAAAKQPVKAQAGQALRAPSDREAAGPRKVAASAAPAAAPSAPAPARKESPRRSAVPGRRGMPLVGIVVPFCLCAAGGTAASWFLVWQQNPVMAGIVGLTTIVGAAFAWLFLRG